jgi:hypothetical protein
MTTINNSNAVEFVSLESASEMMIELGTEYKMTVESGNNVERLNVLRKMNSYCKSLVVTTENVIHKFEEEVKRGAVDRRRAELVVAFEGVLSGEVLKAAVEAALLKEFPREESEKKSVYMKPSKDLPANMQSEILSILCERPPVGSPKAVLEANGKSGERIHSILISRHGFSHVPIEKTQAFVRWMHSEGLIEKEGATRGTMYFRKGE